MRKHIMAMLAPTCLGIAASQGSVAGEGGGWQYEVTPYFLAAGLDGTAGIRGVESDIDVPFSDILDDLEAGFMGMFTAQNGPWTLALEAVYFKLEDTESRSVSGNFGHVDVKGALELTSKMYIYQGSVGYRVLDDRAKVDLIGALRYTRLAADASVKITTNPAIVFPGGNLRAKGSESWTDGVVGARVLYPVSDHTSLVGYADVGGGGSDNTYQFLLGVNWEFRKDYTAKLGYRQLSWDYEEDGTVWDMTASGPYLGIGVRF